MSFSETTGDKCVNMEMGFDMIVDLFWGEVTHGTGKYRIGQFKETDSVGDRMITLG